MSGGNPITEQSTETGAHGPRGPMNWLIDTIELIAAGFVGIVAADIFISVMLRYFFSVQIPDAYDFGRLLLGILMALILRGVFIAVGAAAMALFHRGNSVSQEDEAEARLLRDGCQFAQALDAAELRVDHRGVDHVVVVGGLFGGRQNGGEVQVADPKAGEVIDARFSISEGKRLCRITAGAAQLESVGGRHASYLRGRDMQ